MMVLTRGRTNRSPVMEWWRTIDRPTLYLFFGLLTAGLVLSLASSPAAAERMNYDDNFRFFKRHLIFAIMGLTGAFVVSTFSALNARRVAVLALIGAVLALLVVIAVGDEVKGAKRWIDFGPLKLQPSEFVKPAFIVFAAWMFSVQREDRQVPGTGIVFVAYFLLIGMLIQQPDFGQSFLLTLCFSVVFFYAGLSLFWVLSLFVATIGMAVAAYNFLPHVRARVEVFLSPESGDAYQTKKALEAIANGGLLGRGPGEGSIKYQIPDMHSDFIFAVTVEEFGFLVSSMVIFLIGAFVVRSFRNALRLNDHFGQLAVAGLASMIGFQAIINLAVNLNLVPAKGLTLPFISYGGSSMLSLCFAAGLILAFTRKRPGVYGFKGGA